MDEQYDRRTLSYAPPPQRDVPTARSVLLTTLGAVGRVLIAVIVVGLSIFFVVESEGYPTSAKVARLFIAVPASVFAALLAIGGARRFAGLLRHAINPDH